MPPDLIPRETIFGNPVKANPHISPDGKKMAFVAPVDNVLNVWAGDIATGEYRPVTKDTDRGITSYFWSEDNRRILYVRDVGGNENWRLYDVNLETMEIRDLTPYENVQVQIIDHNKHFPDDLLIAMNKENEQVHDVYHLHLPTGEMRMVAKNPGNIAEWLVDAHMKVRGAMVATPEGGYDLIYRNTEESEWKKIMSWNSEDALVSGPLCFTEDDQFLYLRDSRDVNASRLIKMNLTTGERNVLAEDSEYDVSGVIVEPDTYEVQAVVFMKAREEWVVLDPSIADDLAAIRTLNSGDFFLPSRDRDNQTWLVGFTTDDGPVPYYTYDRKTKQGAFLFYTRPELTKYKLAPMEPISFQSRDGLTIHGYLTLPIGEPGKNLPLVLNVHGGPWHRDNWGYHPEAQWLANRGYACLQVNFRGSTGYGKNFLNAGNREWGRNMQNDLTDAVKWAVDQGYADPKRLAIYGGSYGGYAALAGATFTPDLFNCAIAIVGPSNLMTFVRSIPPYWSTFLAMLHQRVGNPDTEPDFLMSRSPLSKVDQIRIPMLIAQGANDPRVKRAESEQIVQAMKDNGIDHQYMLFEDEGHGFAKTENRLKFYAEAERFLAKHLGGRVE
jgi:dipeptidyl aminopeptidase/acylaminoacyl peptidase